MQRWAGTGGMQAGGWGARTFKIVKIIFRAGDFFFLREKAASLIGYAVHIGDQEKKIKDLGNKILSPSIENQALQFKIDFLQMRIDMHVQCPTFGFPQQLHVIPLIHILKFFNSECVMMYFQDFKYRKTC